MDYQEYENQCNEIRRQNSEYLSLFEEDMRKSVDSGRKECPLRYGGAGFRFGRRETPEIFGCDYLAVEMDDGDISFPFISMR